MSSEQALSMISCELGGATSFTERVRFAGTQQAPSVYAVSDLASSSVAAACLAVAELIETCGGPGAGVTIDRRPATYWFGSSISPLGWILPDAWEPIAGDYQAADGWVRLHTNAAHHRAAALRVLEVPGERDRVAAAVRGWSAAALEKAVVESGGCAAAMRSAADWASHPQGQAVAAEKLVDVERADPAPSPDWTVPAVRPLQGVRVLDLTRVLAGPVATRFLAGFGAEVLRIDPPDWDEPSILPGVTLGKRCARLDLRSPSDLATLHALLSQADVLVHGYRPGALAGLGFDAAARRALRPGLVDVSLDAYGWSGSWRTRRGFDSLVQMSSGIAEAGMRLGGRDRPTPLPVQALDHATGYLMAAAAVRGLLGVRTAGVGGSARFSLARTAALLTSLPVPPPEPLSPKNDDDHAPDVEQTSWGPVRRLRPPGVVEGTPMRWDRPATALGTSEPRWA